MLIKINCLWKEYINDQSKIICDKDCCYIKVDTLQEMMDQLKFYKKISSSLIIDTIEII